MMEFIKGLHDIVTHTQFDGHIEKESNKLSSKELKESAAIMCFVT